MSALLDCFQNYMALQKESTKLFSTPNQFKNLCISEYKDGRTKPLLHFIVEHIVDAQLLDLLDICLKLDFNANIQNKVNETTLHVNFKRSPFCCEITRLLMQRGANPCLITTPRNEKGVGVGRETALHYLTKRQSEMNIGQPCTCITIISQHIQTAYGLNVDAKNLNGQTPLHIAVMNNKPNYVKQLLDCKASPVTAFYLNPAAMKGYKPIHLACKIGSKQILSLILLSIFENCNNFQLSEKTSKNEDPLDLILNNFDTQHKRDYAA